METNLVNGLKTLHKNKIIHRDLKPEVNFYAVMAETEKATSMNSVSYDLRVGQCHREKVRLEEGDTFLRGWRLKSQHISGIAKSVGTHPVPKKYENFFLGPLIFFDFEIFLKNGHFFNVS
jgi:hypothetical protein